MPKDVKEHVAALIRAERERCLIEYRRACRARSAGRLLDSDGHAVLGRPPIWQEATDAATNFSGCLLVAGQTASEQLPRRQWKEIPSALNWELESFIANLGGELRVALSKPEIQKEPKSILERGFATLRNFKPTVPKRAPKSPRRGNEIVFLGEGRVQYRGIEYRVTNGQEAALWTCMELWKRQGKEKSLRIDSSSVFTDKDERIGRIFRDHPFYTKLGVLKTLSKPRGFFVFNP